MRSNLFFILLVLNILNPSHAYSRTIKPKSAEYMCCECWYRDDDGASYSVIGAIPNSPYTGVLDDTETCANTCEETGGYTSSLFYGFSEEDCERPRSPFGF